MPRPTRPESVRTVLNESFLTGSVNTSIAEEKSTGPASRVALSARSATRPQAALGVITASILFDLNRLLSGESTKNWRAFMVKGRHETMEVYLSTATASCSRIPYS